MLRTALSRGRLPSLILWGPPGCGKTTLAHLLARELEADFVALSAVDAGVRDVRAVIKTAQGMRRGGRRTLLFLDEIHRFNKAQQDVVLPHVEDGTIILIGATTENPSFEVIPPLLSRTRVIRLDPLGDESIEAIVREALGDEQRGLGRAAPAVSAEGMTALVGAANGDARRALTTLEIAADLVSGGGEIDSEVVAQAVQTALAGHGKRGDAHYDIVSALIKSLRGSDPDAALYWMARMIEGGEDILFIARRLVIFAAEDVGLADPQALPLAVACQQAVHFVGLPEAVLPLSECCVYLASAPKSNSAMAAYGRASEAARETPHLPPPKHILNAPTALMRGMGHGGGYRYPHDEPDHIARDVDYFPDGFDGLRRFYEAGALGPEGDMAARLARIRGDRHGDLGNGEEDDGD